MIRLRLCFLAFGGFAALASAQQVPIKPGLWEIRQTSTDGAGKAMADISARLKSIPRDGSARVDAGVEKDAPPAGSDSVKLCFTAEQLRRDDWLTHPGRCKMEVRSRTASTWKWRSVCTQPTASTTEGETQFSGDEAFSTRMTTTLQRGGRKETMQRESSGRWLGADCGSLGAAPKN